MHCESLKQQKGPNLNGSMLPLLHPALLLITFDGYFFSAVDIFAAMINTKKNVKCPTAPSSL